LSVEDVPSEPVPVLVPVPGLGIDAQKAWTVSPLAVAAAVNLEKATDDRDFPRVVLADARPSGAKYAVHRPNSLAVVVGAAHAVLWP
jgi:hypothetical protein